MNTSTNQNVKDDSVRPAKDSRVDHRPPEKHHVSTIRFKVPAREEVISVAASRKGATLQLGAGSYKLTRDEAVAIADALVDAAEAYA